MEKNSRMKTWQIYTLIGLAACITLMQAWTTYRMVQSEAVFPMKAVQYLKKKEFDKQLNTLKTTTYYWRAIPKDQLTEEYVQEEIDNDDLVKKGSVDRYTVEDNLHKLLDPIYDEEYVGTLYETDKDVVIVYKKTETSHATTEDFFYHDPNNPEDCDPFK